MVGESFGDRMGVLYRSHKANSDSELIERGLAAFASKFGSDGILACRVEEGRIGNSAEDLWFDLVVLTMDDGIVVKGFPPFDVWWLRNNWLCRLFSAPYTPFRTPEELGRLLS